MTSQQRYSRPCNDFPQQSDTFARTVKAWIEYRREGGRGNRIFSLLFSEVTNGSPIAVGAPFSHSSLPFKLILSMVLRALLLLSFATASLLVGYFDCIRIVVLSDNHSESLNLNNIAKLNWILNLTSNPFLQTTFKDTLSTPLAQKWKYLQNFRWF